MPLWTVLKPYLWKYVLVFFDDILFYNLDLFSHRKQLRLVFQLLRQNHLVVNRKKCYFVEWEFEYLGHVVSANRLAADPQKIEAILKWQPPKDIKGLTGFLGLSRLLWVLTSIPVLALSNFSKLFVLEIDASNKGVGVVLSQGQPIVFLSQTLSEQAQVNIWKGAYGYCACSSKVAPLSSWEQHHHSHGSKES